MTGVFLSKQYEIPYYIREIDKNIYSAEELSYFLYNYLPVVDKTFFCDELAEYLEDILGMKAVANRMRDYIHQRGTLSDLVLLTVKASEYYGDMEILSLQNRLEERKKMTASLEAKEKAETFVRLGKYGQAAETYLSCLREGQAEQTDDAFQARIYCGLGNVYGRMLRFDEAEEAYRSSMRLSPNADAQKKFVLLLLIQDREKDILSYREEFQLSEPLVRECQRVYGRMKQICRQANPAVQRSLAEIKADYRKENGYH